MWIWIDDLGAIGDGFGGDWLLSILAFAAIAIAAIGVYAVVVSTWVVLLIAVAIAIVVGILIRKFDNQPLAAVWGAFCMIGTLIFYIATMLQYVSASDSFVAFLGLWVGTITVSYIIGCIGAHVAGY